nr:hypothetical protein Iba_chr05bCG10270 [Ipomoea batatas]GMD00503.1 hypothetical protein Iba_chr05eCG15870 [Ipomoea batatas]GMD02088.1 hypothetical protein Iba_chr05fCG13290 [Ipomoea batatas]
MLTKKPWFCKNSKFLKGSGFGDTRRPSILSPPTTLILPSDVPIAKSC